MKGEGEGPVGQREAAVGLCLEAYARIRRSCERIEQWKKIRGDRTWKNASLTDSPSPISLLRAEYVSWEFVGSHLLAVRYMRRNTPFGKNCARCRNRGAISLDNSLVAIGNSWFMILENRFTIEENDNSWSYWSYWSYLILIATRNDFLPANGMFYLVRQSRDLLIVSQDS